MFFIEGFVCFPEKLKIVHGLGDAIAYAFWNWIANSAHSFIGWLQVPAKDLDYSLHQGVFLGVLAIMIPIVILIVQSILREKDDTANGHSDELDKLRVRYLLSEILFIKIIFIISLVGLLVTLIAELCFSSSLSAYLILTILETVFLVWLVIIPLRKFYEWITKPWDEIEFILISLKKLEDPTKQKNVDITKLYSEVFEIKNEKKKSFTLSGEQEERFVSTLTNTLRNLSKMSNYNATTLIIDTINPKKISVLRSTEIVNCILDISKDQITSSGDRWIYAMGQYPKKIKDFFDIASEAFSYGIIEIFNQKEKDLENVSARAYMIWFYRMVAEIVLAQIKHADELMTYAPVINNFSVKIEDLRKNTIKTEIKTNIFKEHIKSFYNKNHSDKDIYENWYSLLLFTKAVFPECNPYMIIIFLIWLDGSVNYSGLARISNLKRLSNENISCEDLNPESANEDFNGKENELRRTIDFIHLAWGNYFEKIIDLNEQIKLADEYLIKQRQREDKNIEGPWYYNVDALMNILQGIQAKIEESTASSASAEPASAAASAPPRAPAGSEREPHQTSA